jgi:hypothetical protein
MPKWLRGLFRKSAMDATAKSEINTGGGTYDETADSLEAIADSGGGGLTQADVRTAIGMQSANLDTQLAALSASTGSGPYPLVLTVTDGTDPLEGAGVLVVHGAENYRGLTASNGTITFNLNTAGTWTITAACVGYTYAGGTVTTAAGAATVTMTAISITPPATGYTTCVFTVLDTDNVTPLAGAQVEFQMIAAPAGSTGFEFNGAAVILTADVNGVVQREVPQGAKCQIVFGAQAKAFTAGATSTTYVPSFVATS